MNRQKIHLHSMMVHSIAALAPLAALAYIFLKQRVSLFSIDQRSWAFLVVLSLILIFLITLPSVISGVFERNHIYAKWHSTHKIKLVLSGLLTCLLFVELLLLQAGELNGPLFSTLGILVIFANNIVIFLLCKYGLKITLGRQSLTKTSYEPDLFKKEPVDILVMAGKLKKEQPKYMDLLTER
ncbi:MAG: hypothetical protein HQ517_07060 [SAR324 cluster bacterium]|nr:hypothetical protein [SAR324 cluster bacterium]